MCFVYSKGCIVAYIRVSKCIFCMYKMTILHVYSNIIININDLDIMITVGAYFEYIKILYSIFIKCIVAILQVYPSYFITFLKIITNSIYNIV